MNICKLNHHRKIFILFFIMFLLVTDSIDSYAGDDTWTTQGPYGAEIWSIAVNPSNSQDILAGISGGLGAQVYRSLNGGNSWFSSSNGLPSIPYAVYGIAYDPINSNNVYIATPAGVFKSLDGGEMWQSTTLTIGAFSLAVNPADGRTLYAGAGDYGNGVWKSTDGGESWTNILNHAGRILVVVSPSAPHILYAGSREGGLFRSDDSGQTWQEVNGGFVSPPGVSALVVDSFSSSIVYLGTNNGLYRTLNSGDSWTPVSAGLGSTDIRALAIDVGNQEIIYVGTGPGGGTPGVYRSTDSSGTSWTSMNAGMGSVPILSLVTDKAHPLSLYAGSTGTGVWKYTPISSDPLDYSISINDGALFTNQITVTLTMIAAPGTTEMQVSNDGGFGGTTWEPYTNTKLWTVTAYGGYVIPRTVYTKFKTSGQVSGLYQDDIILDQMPPTGMIQITDTVTSTVASLTTAAYSPAWLSTATYTVSLPLVGKNYFPGLRLIGLSLSAIDDVSGIDRMLISNDATFANAQWQVYTTKLNWYVKDTGISTVYVKYRDRAGNQSQVYSADTTAP